MYPRNMYKNINKLISNYSDSIGYNVIIKGLLFFHLSYRSDNPSPADFKAFRDFISLNRIGTLMSVDNSNTDINLLKNLYYDINRLSEFIEDDSILSLAHELSFNKSSRKKSGVYYTPQAVIRPILDKLLNDMDIVSNPYIKILDPACGCGNFLYCAYDKLYDLYMSNSDKLKARYGNHWDKEYIKKHILHNNLFGADIDSYALAITIERLSSIDDSIDFYSKNIVLCDSIVKWEEDTQNISKNAISSFWAQKFDFIIGNPPYHNMQKSNTEFKEYVKVNYSEIYNGQNDLYYYFIYRAIDRLKEGGKLCYIVPPYFIKSTHGSKLRQYIIDNLDINYFEDISYLKPFYKTQIHSCVFAGEKKKKGLQDSAVKKVNININNQVLLAKSSEWTIVDNNTISIIEKLNRVDKLGKYAFICKGMDTGLNKCFLVNDSIISQFKLEPELIKPVVRSGDIENYFIKKSQNNAVLYITDRIDISNFQSAHKYLEKFYDELKLRWSYKKNICNLYSISAPRSSNLFESRKLRLFVPYRSRSNKFAIDSEANIGLTDTTVLFTNDDTDIYYLSGILNSKLISFYNSLCGKRKGDMFEFFSVPLSSIPIIASKNRLYYEIIDNVKKILDANKKNNKSNIEELQDLQECIDYIVFETYGIGDKDTRIIINYLMTNHNEGY